jgi:hypothetical protein
MEFYLNLKKIHSGKYEAQVREARRLLCLGRCLESLGQIVVESKQTLFDNGSDPNHDRLGIFFEPSGPKDYIHLSSEWSPRHVVLKTLASNHRDEHTIRNCQVLMAHEYDGKLENSPLLFPIPFPVYNLILEHFYSIGLLEAYLDDDIHSIRKVFEADDPNPEQASQHEPIGFLGYEGYGRPQMIEEFRRIYPHLDIQLYSDGNRQRIQSDKYLKRISGWRAGLCLPGNTPKTSRFSELALMGIPIITTCRKPRVHPAVTNENTILLRNWSDREGLNFALRDLNQISMSQDQAYLNGWSFMSQARNLLHVLNTHWEEEVESKIERSN